ncbi:hypothetical protein L930_08855 [Helicobacter pylori PZ5004]|nr:hypothetical protein L930_08855 [Helicobacter pylori PZ5004]
MGLLSFRIKLRGFDFGVLIFRAFGGFYEVLKGGNYPKIPPNSYS